MKETSIIVDSENVQIKRMARRRHLLLTVSHDFVTVKAPFYTSNQEIKRFVLEQLPWIHTQKKKLPPKPSFQHGDSLLFMGHPHTLHIHLASRSVQLEDNQLLVYHPKPTPETTARQLKQFYQSQALHTLSERTEHLESVLRLKSNSVTVRSYKARWGSCDKNGHIQFNWQLIMAPSDVIDYVIIHELCHLVHFDHSPSFWALVRSFCPDYKHQKKWLNGHSQLLNTLFN